MFAAAAMSTDCSEGILYLYNFKTLQLEVHIERELSLRRLEMVNALHSGKCNLKLRQQVSTSIIMGHSLLQLVHTRPFRNRNARTKGFFITGRDGLVRVYDMSTNYTPIMRWKADDSELHCVRFSRDETALFTLGTEDKVT